VDADGSYGRRILGPVRSRAPWVAGGLVLQAVGAGGVSAYLWHRVRHQNADGHITAAMIRLAWHGEVHTRSGLAVLAAGTIVYAVGSVLMARPHVARPVTLFVAVPLTAVAGMLVLGLLALIVALVMAAVANNVDVPVPGFGGSGNKANQRGRSLDQQVAKLTQATRAGQPVSATLPAALHAGEAVPPRPHAWKRGQLKITPSSVTWQRRRLPHGQSRDLTGARYIKQRQPDWSGTDRRLSAPGYLAPSIRVLALQTSHEQIEITLPAQAIDAALRALTQLNSHHGTSQMPGSPAGGQ
jgi:hypothetical protein